MTHALPPERNGPAQPETAPSTRADESHARPVTGPEQAPSTEIRRSRAGALWLGLIIAAVILVLLLIFIIQNSQTVDVEFFGLQGQLSLAVAILLGVAAGALLVVIPGSVRILQLRKKTRHLGG